MEQQEKQKGNKSEIEMVREEASGLIQQAKGPALQA